MGKKIPKEMEAQKEKLHAGLLANGMTEAKAKELWSLIEPFAAYGFNKAHAASYGRVAYQTSYMKANFTSEYMTAVLSAEAGDVEEIATIIGECKKIDIPVLPPDVNESFGDFAVIKAGIGDLSDLTPEAAEMARRFQREKDTIRFGLYTIKNLGTEISDFIVDERKRGGPYTSFQNFLERVTHKNMNKKSLEALIKSGAMDSLGLERGAMLGNMEEALAYNKENVSLNSDQISLFGEMTDTSSIPSLKFKEVEPISSKLKLAWEKELLGLYLSGHPLQEFQDKFDKAEHTIRSIKTLAENTVVVVGGVVETVREITTKKGDRMAFVKIADFNDQIESVFFSRTYNDNRELVQADKCLAIKGKISLRNGEPSLIVEGVKELT
jgi:DNA polymerase-3 subunit alpha